MDAPDLKPRRACCRRLRRPRAATLAGPTLAATDEGEPSAMEMDASSVAVFYHLVFTWKIERLYSVLQFLYFPAHFALVGYMFFPAHSMLVGLHTLI